MGDLSRKAQQVKGKRIFCQTDREDAQRAQVLSNTYGWYVTMLESKCHIGEAKMHLMHARQGILGVGLLIAAAIIVFRLSV